jgi:hypothetical protein
MAFRILNIKKIDILAETNIVTTLSVINDDLFKFTENLSLLGNMDILKLPKITIICKCFIQGKFGVVTQKTFQMVIEGLKNLRKKQKFAIMVPEYPNDLCERDIRRTLQMALKNEDIPIIITSCGRIEKLVYPDDSKPIQEGNMLYAYGDRIHGGCDIHEMTEYACMLGDAVAAIFMDHYPSFHHSHRGAVERINSHHKTVWASSQCSQQLTKKTNPLMTDQTKTMFKFDEMLEV